MIALVASIRLLQEEECKNLEISIKPRWRLEELNV